MALLCLVEEKWYLFLKRLFYLPKMFFFLLWLRKTKYFNVFFHHEKGFSLWIFFSKKNLRQCLHSWQMSLEWTRVVLFFRFFESGSFFSLSFSFLLFVLLSINRGWDSCCSFLFICVSLFRRLVNIMSSSPI